MQTNAEDTSFYQVPKTLFRARHFVSPKTGEHIKLSQNDKAVYTVILDRFTFFKGQGKEHYDTQEYIAEESGVLLRTTNTIIAKLIEHQVIEVRETRTAGGHKKLVYLSVKPLALLEQTKDKTKTASNPASKAPKKPPKSPAEPSLSMEYPTLPSSEETHQIGPLEAPPGDYEFINYERDNGYENSYVISTSQTRVLETMIFDQDMGITISADELEKGRKLWLERQQRQSPQ